MNFCCSWPDMKYEYNIEWDWFWQPEWKTRLISLQLLKGKLIPKLSRIDHKSYRNSERGQSVRTERMRRYSYVFYQFPTGECVQEDFPVGMWGIVKGNRLLLLIFRISPKINLPEKAEPVLPPYERQECLCPPSFISLEFIALVHKNLHVANNWKSIFFWNFSYIIL